MPTALLVERNEDTRRRLARLLRRRRYRITGTGSAVNLVEQVRDASPDLLILDIKMPDASFDAIRQIKKFSPDLSILVLAEKGQVSPAGMSGTHVLIRPFEDAKFDQVLNQIDARSSEENSAVADASRSMNRTPSLRIALPELHAPETGRIDAERIAEYLGVPLSKLSEALGVNYSTLHKTPSAPSLQEALSPIKRSLDILSDVFRDRSTIRVWLNSPHPDLGRRTPLQVILEGRSIAVETILENALAGVPT